jgi:hypothetical protein
MGLWGTWIAELPKVLGINGDLDLRDTPIEWFPSMAVGRSVWMGGCENWNKLVPDDANVGGIFTDYAAELDPEPIGDW